jgi:hypothetical protein
MNFAAHFDAGFTYHDFLKKYGTEEHRRRWAGVHDAARLSAAQRELLAGFVRQMKVLCLAGTWCGDCVNQCPIFEHFSAVSSKIVVRYVDRDADSELAEALKICGGSRVPVAVFLSEDDRQVGWYGDRTLSKYRQMAVEQLGNSCPTGINPPDRNLLDAVTQDWLNEFERVQLLLRTSSRLRQLHAD